MWVGRAETVASSGDLTPALGRGEVLHWAGAATAPSGRVRVTHGPHFISFFHQRQKRSHPDSGGGVGLYLSDFPMKRITKPTVTIMFMSFASFKFSLSLVAGSLSSTDIRVTANGKAQRLGFCVSSIFANIKEHSE